MGLDLIEFTMAVEDAFHLAIPDADAAQLRTPGDLVDYLLLRLTTASAPPVCLEQRAFYGLRQAGMQTLGQPRAAFQPATQWTTLLPPERSRRRRAWQLLQHATGTTKWPAMSLWGDLSADVKSVGATARYLAAHTPASFSRDAAWSRAQVEQIVRQLMAAELAVTEFQWDQRFVQDLGLD